MKRPPITIACDCGERKEVPYGEAWQCEKCGRRWNTQQIPAAEYEGLLRSMRRFRLEVLGFALAAAVWLFLYLPSWRRKVRRAAGEAPRWEIHPE